MGILSKELTPRRATIILVVAACLAAGDASAYVGPGGGLSIVGSVIALAVAIVAAIFGFVWYPVKRLLRRAKGKPPTSNPPD